MTDETNRPDDTDSKVVGLGSNLGDLAAIDAFASSCGLPADDVARWVQNGTLPSIVFAGQRMVNVQRLRADLLQEKPEFNEGDYSDD